jgi:hypothetical protein
MGETSPPDEGPVVSGYPLALTLTLATEIPIVAAFFPGHRARMAMVCALTTTATHLLLHFALPGLLPVGSFSLVLAEGGITLVEAAAYWAASQDPGRSLAASALANAASFVAGLIVL